MTTEGGLSGQTILRFYYPLALSWLFMGLEAPVCMSVISHMSEPEVNAAAFFIMMSLSIWIESPVIDLLSTSTTLAKDGDRFALISKFVLRMMIWVTFAHAIFVFTPLYTLIIEGVMQIKHEVAAAARPGMAILTFWSAAIGWRRYLQGILIRSGLTRVIGFGTLSRIVTISTTAYLLHVNTNWSGVVIAACALMLSVAIETLFIHIVSRPTVHDLRRKEPIEGEPLTMHRLMAFHFPLTATTMVKLLVFPIIGAGLARVNDPVLATAAYQFAGTIIFLHRALGFCLPEVVIALYKDEASRAALRRFSLGVAIGTMSSMLILSITGADRVIFEDILGAKRNISDLAHLVFFLSCAVPFLDAVQSYIRGVLTAHHLTVSRLLAVGVSVSSLMLVVSLGVSLHWSGPVLAAVSLTVALAAEFAVLAFSWARSQNSAQLRLS
ncbi:MAG: hypothetical protein ACAH95_09675 [Fimbriimonas sp.]